MPTEFESIFARLKLILQKHAKEFSVTEDTPAGYCLQGKPGPATLQAWGGKMKNPAICVACVQIGKAYVSYHLMGAYGNTKLLDQMSSSLKARMQGKTCFNFKKTDESLFTELERITTAGIAGFRKAGFVV